MSEESQDAVGAENESSDAALLSRLQLIEDRPLADRAAALEQVHAELRAALESGDASRPLG